MIRLALFVFRKTTAPSIPSARRMRFASRRAHWTTHWAWLDLSTNWRNRKCEKKKQKKCCTYVENLACHPAWNVPCRICRMRAWQYFRDCRHRRRLGSVRRRQPATDRCGGAEIPAPGPCVVRCRRRGDVQPPWNFPPWTKWR